MSFNYDKLRGRIVEIFKTQTRFAIAMGWSERTLSLRMTGARAWKQPDISKAVKLLNLKPEDIPVYFFTAEVQGIELNEEEKGA